MLRVSPEFILLVPGAVKTRGTIMGNVALTEELAGSAELDELYRLGLCEAEPEDDEDQDGEDEDGEDEGIQPEEFPHG